MPLVKLCCLLYNVLGDFMKKNANILEYVEKYKYKYGINYSTDGGRLVNTLSVISYIVWIYIFCVTVLFLVSTGLMLSVGHADFNYIANSFITICIGTALMIAGAVLYLCRQKIVGCAITFLSQPVMVIAYSHIARNSAGVLNSSFYWRHAVPGALLLCLAGWIAFVLIRANIKTNKLYNMLVTGLYKQYGKHDGEALSEDEWEEFLTKYNPYKQLD